MKKFFAKIARFITSMFSRPVGGTLKSFRATQQNQAAGNGSVIVVNIHIDGK